MDVTTALDAPCAAPALFAWVDDLGRYPQWLQIVARAEPDPATVPGLDPAWRVDLRGRLGPVARTKRLRMVRTVHDAPRRVVFERREDDGRSHSAWVLTAEVAEGPPGPDGVAASRLTVHLHYGGTLWGPMLERMLGDEIEHSRTRLLALVEGAGAAS